MRRLWVLFLCAGCRDLLAPPLTGDPDLIQPPPAFARWYRLAEQCSGRAGYFPRVRWYVYRQPRIPSGAAAATTVFPHSRRVVIAQPYLADSAVVIHESLHEIIGSTADVIVPRTPDHPVWIAERCGHLIGVTWHD